MTDITELAQSLKATAEPISSGYLRNWIVSHDDETCWVGANDDEGNLTPFIEVSIADWSGNKADNEKLAQFIALYRPANVLALVEALEKAQQRIFELESKLANPVQLPKTNGYWTEQEKAYEEAITLAKRQIRVAGFRCEGDE